MIVVVEGPSAAGKSTWVRSHAGATAIPEERVDEPDASSSDTEIAAYWTAVNARRWAHALHTEREHGLAVCDVDPFKLHYAYGLHRLGRVSRERFDVEVTAFRSVLVEQRLGIADVVLCSIPSNSTLEAHRRADTERRRHRFALHQQLSESLREWYAALDAADPGRVIWHFPEELPTTVSRPRYDVALFDNWIARLPRER